MTLTFVVLSTLPRLGKVIPPLIAAVIVGALAIWAFGKFKPPAGALFALAAPNLYVPQFSWDAMVELVVPLAITVLAVQNGQGVAVLAANGHAAPVNAITVACGIGSIVTGLFGAVSTCLTGPVNAVLASAGEKQRQYTAALLFCVFALSFGLLAPFFTRLLLGTPPAFIATLAGLAMLRVLPAAVTPPFPGRSGLGAPVALLLPLAHLPLFHIG